MQSKHLFQPELFIDEKHLVEALFIHASIGIIVADRQREMIRSNPFILDQFSYTTEEKGRALNKARFVSLASHEFSPPLSTLLSSTYLLQKYTTTVEQDKRENHFERVISSVNTLTDILNDFLSVGKIEEGKINH